MKISVTEAARMRSAVQMSSRWTYNISEGLLMKYLGKEDKNDDTDT